MDNYYSCFLNPNSNFIWAFIAPVIVIILTNIGFFIMAAVTIWRHNERKGGDIKSARSWLKVLVSLVVVMGLTWISGVLIVVVDELLPLAYIFTIMVAFQGVWIFFFFILIQEQVRDAYLKLWRTMTKTQTDIHREKNKNTASTEMVSIYQGS